MIFISFQDSFSKSLKGSASIVSIFNHKIKIDTYSAVNDALLLKVKHTYYRNIVTKIEVIVYYVSATGDIKNATVIFEFMNWSVYRKLRHEGKISLQDEVYKKLDVSNLVTPNDLELEIDMYTKITVIGDDDFFIIKQLGLTKSKDNEYYIRYFINTAYILAFLMRGKAYCSSKSDLVGEVFSSLIEIPRALDGFDYYYNEKLLHNVGPFKEYYSMKEINSTNYQNKDLFIKKSVESNTDKEIKDIILSIPSMKSYDEFKTTVDERLNEMKSTYEQRPKKVKVEKIFINKDIDPYIGLHKFYMQIVRSPETGKFAFDYIRIEFSVISSVDFDWIKLNYKPIAQKAIEFIKNNKDFLKFGVPINILTLEKITLTKEKMVHFLFGIKKLDDKNKENS